MLFSLFSLDSCLAVISWPYSLFWLRMCSLREEVTSRDFSLSSAALEGILIPRPPSRVGRAYRASCGSLGGGLPVNAGMSSDLSTSSRRESSSPMLGVTWSTYSLTHVLGL